MLINITDFSTVCSDYEIEQFTAIGEELQIAERAALEQMASYLRHRYDTEKAFSATGEERTHIEQMARRRQSVRLTAELMRNTDSLTKKDLKTRTPSVGGEQYAPSRGLKSKPGSGEIFSDDHLYFPEDCHICPFGGALQGLWADLTGRKNCMKCKRVQACNDGTDADKRIENYDEKEWERTYTPLKGGFVVTQRERIAESKASKAERKKFDKEMRMCMVLADNGHDVEYLKGENRPIGQTYDIHMDGIKADLKCITKGAGNIVKYARKALKEQGAEAVVFEIPSHAFEFYDALTEARRKCNGRIFFYFSDDMELKEIKK